MKRLQIIKKVKSRQFFFRVFYYFSVLLMLTVILMAATYFVTNRGVESQYYDKMQYNLEEVSKTVDSQVEMVQNLGLNFFAADVIGQYFKPDAQRTVEINAEQWRVVRVILQNKTIFGDALNELYAYFQGENRVYTAAGVYEADFFFENVCKYEEYPLEFWQTERMKDNDGMNVLLPSIVERTGDRTSIEVIPVVTAQNLSGKTAVFVANDSLAIGCYKAVHENGLAIPEDISVVGYNDIPAAKYLVPPLTTVHLYMDFMGEQAVLVLAERILTGREISIQTLIPAKLVIRESVKRLGRTE